MQIKVIHADNDYKFDKNPNQMLSIGPELNDLLVVSGKKKGEKVDRYQQGGLGCVTKEGPKSFYEDRGVDVRSVVPYYGECLEGELRILRLPREEREKRAKDKENYKLPNLLDPKWIFKVPGDYVTSPNEFYILIPEGKTKDQSDGNKEKYKYILLEDMGIKGEVTSLKEAYMETQKIPYRVFRQVNHLDAEKYFVHTPQTAAMKVSYGKNGAYQVGQIIGEYYDAYYADFDRTLVEAGRQFEERLGFNPASIWLHDRQGFTYLFEMIRRSAEGDKFENGKKTHNTFHNPGRDYQGHIDDIESFMRIAFDESDFIKLKEHPQYGALKRILSKPKKSVADRKIIEAFFKPYFESMIDEMGTANQTMIPIAAVGINPDNATIGTVSKTYGIEMITLNDIAKGITKPLFAIKDRIINVTNGSLPASLNINNSEATFGSDSNGLSSLHKREYIPFNPIRDNNCNTVNYDKSYLDFLNEKIKEFDEKAKNLPSETKEYLDYKKIVDGYKEELKKFRENEKNLPKLEEKYKAAKLEKENYEKSENVEEAKLKELGEICTKAEKDYWALSDSLNTLKFSIKEAKAMNKKWYFDLVSKQYVPGNPKQTKLNLEKLFFDKIQRENRNFEVHGYITNSGDGRDKIYANWGRPDNQKGFATFLQGFYKFLKMKTPPQGMNISQEDFEDMKKHAKLIFGSGNGRWEKDAPEFKIINEYIEKIQKIYPGSVCYINGLFPNRLVACSDFGFFTSRFEPCGITPLESYAAGAPVASIRTGGAPDFVGDIDEVDSENATGFLTEHPFMRNPEDLEKAGYMNIEEEKKKILNGNTVWTEAMNKKFSEVLDEKRRDAASDEIAKMFVRTMKVANDEKAYDNLSKNCLKQLIEWAKNEKYNRGYVKNSNGDYIKDTTIGEDKLKAADDIYLEDSFGVTGKLKEGESREFIRPRSTAPMKKLTGEFPKYVDFEKIIRENPDPEEVENNLEEDDPFTYSNISFKGLASINSINLYSKANIKNNNTKVFVG